jgi:CheY-like chemotaxis protein
MLLSRDVKRQGHLVAPLRTGGQALEALGAEPFDVVLLDVLMPENGRLRDAANGPEPDARLLSPYVELAQVDEVARRAQEGLASRIRNEN